MIITIIPAVFVFALAALFAFVFYCAWWEKQITKFAISQFNLEYASLTDHHHLAAARDAYVFFYIWRGCINLDDKNFRGAAEFHYEKLRQIFGRDKADEIVFSTDV